MVDEDAGVAQLRDDIVPAAYSQGQHLVQVEVAKRANCGRPRVRAALVWLESEGLIERRVNNGAVVWPVSIAEAIERAEARSVLESLIAGRAPRHVPAADDTDLREILARTRLAVNAKDWARNGKLNRELHRRIHALGRHAVAPRLSTNIRDCGVHHQFHLSLLQGRRDQVFVEPPPTIVDAIVDGDEDRAAATMRTHMASTAHALQRLGNL